MAGSVPAAVAGVDLELHGQAIMGTTMAKREIVQRFEVVFEPDEDGGIHVYVPVLKGCHSWGATREEAREHVKEAIELWLESARERGIPIPDRETVEITTA